MNTLDNLHVAEPATEEAITSNTVRVTYRFTVCGQERTFTADATVSGSAADAALSLTTAVLDDARRWLGAQTPKAPTTVLVKAMFGHRRMNVMAERVEPTAKPERGSVAASVEINGLTHEYTGEVSTAGNPYRATSAALYAAKGDLWDWAWTRKVR
jgi:hypothetical protein